SLLRDPDAHYLIYEFCEQVRSSEAPNNQYCDTDELCSKLSGVAVEQSGNSAGYSVVPVAISAISEKPECQYAPDTVHAVHRYGSYRIVDLASVFNKMYRHAYQNARYTADNESRDAVDESAGSGYRDQARESSVAGHRRIRLAVFSPHIEHRCSAADRA